MAVDIKTVTAVARDYADNVRQVMPVHKVFLYGSYAKGNASELSDVDICFFLNSFLGKEKVEIIATLLGLSSKFKNVFIEPNVFETSDLYDDNPFVKEVLRTGIEI